MTGSRILLSVCLLAVFCLETVWPASPAAASETFPSAPSAQQVEFFESKIRPVLIARCYKCHADQPEGAKGNLRLDFAQGWREGGDSGPAILPGKPAESLLIHSLKYDGYEMPPEGQLPAEVIADFETWVKMGAPDPRTEPITGGGSPRPIDVAAGREFWSFRPRAAAPTPETHNTDWPRSWIDQFILHRLETAGLKPSPDLDAARLLRRLSYDLVGLPPTVEELHEFQTASRIDPEAALIAAIDRRIDSTEFGEHWGRHWLDVARYADSNGGDFNATFHDAWRYRDYVIRSFNADKPFPQFVREQLAGDLLPADSDAQREEQLIATGFLMIGPKMLSERDKDKLRMDVVDEQVSSVGSAFLGMTLGCARCHDHKFDPVPTADYYALAGIFRSTQTLDGESQRYVSDFVRVPLPIEPEHAAALAAHQERLKTIDKQIASAKKQLEQVKTQTSSSRALGILVDDLEAVKVGDWTISTNFPRFIGTGYSHDNKTDKGEKSITFTPDLPRAGEYEVRFAFAASGGRADNIPVTIRHAGGETVVTVNQVQEPPIEKLFLPLGRFAFEAGRQGSVVVSNTGTTGYVLADAMQFIPVEELAADAKPASQAKTTRQEELDAEIKRLEAEKKDIRAAAPPRAPQAIAVREAEDVGDCHICIRGEHKFRGPLVSRGFLQVAMFDALPQMPAQESGRRELAEWIADSRNPLTARVFVNRVWAYLLGDGIVRTVDNFGVLGDHPSHPELLDRLAEDFIAHNWSVKHLVREIVLSRVYRQSALHREEAFLQDPENRLLWRANRKRLPAESIRDTLLLVSGDLNLERGGSPVEGLGTLVSDNSAAAKTYEGAETTRRSVYMPIIRNEIPTMLAAFDFADPDFVTGRRNETNVPAQALLLLNSPFVRKASASLAERLMADGSGDDTGRVVWAYESILNRTPTGAETDRAIGYVEAVRQSLANAETAEGTAWSRMLQALFASTEFRLLD